MRIGIAGLVGLSFLYIGNSTGMAEQNSDPSVPTGYNQSDETTVKLELPDGMVEMSAIDAAK